MELISLLGKDVRIFPSSESPDYEGIVLPAYKGKLVFVFLPENKPVRSGMLLASGQNSAVYNPPKFEIRNLPDPRGGVRFLCSDEVTIAARKLGRTDVFALGWPRVRCFATKTEALIRFRFVENVEETGDDGELFVIGYEGLMVP